MPGLTLQQQNAAAAHGNVLVMAGAGTGKTRTLVERCLQRLLDPQDPVSLEAVLVVTFTEAAATETRRRIRQRLEEEAARQPADLRLAETIGLADLARISTLHGFCLELVREHFHELGLDPQLTVLDPPQAAILANRTLDETLRRRYAGTTTGDQAVQELVMTHGGGRDDAIRELVLRLHAYAQTLPRPAAWLAGQRDLLDAAEPRHWQRDLIEGFQEWCADWRERLAELAPDNPKAEALLALLPASSSSRSTPAERESRERIAATLAAVLAADADWPKGRKTVLREPLEKVFTEARFLAEVATVTGDQDPLTEDWNWVRPHLAAALDLAREFGTAFAEAKRELAAVDFHDLEQFALRLLWDARDDAPTPLARRWRQRFAHVFVDEYQDINAAQDCILRALSREGADANRFLVGDVKQSIYRFRLANPAIFQAYAAAWAGDAAAGTTIPLNENFRSRPALLDFVNALFTPLMRHEVGGVDYDEAAQLRPGRSDAATEHGHSCPPLHPGDSPNRGADTDIRAPIQGLDSAPLAELLLALDGPGAGEQTGTNARDGDDDERSRAEREAAMVAARLRELKSEGAALWDEGLAALRPVAWRDMVVLLRAPRNKAETYAKEFARVGVPLLARRSGLYETLEVSDLLGLLQLLDNPLQDLPALAVLRSPLVGLSLDELAVIRLALPRERYWTALRRFHETAGPAAAPVAEPTLEEPAVTAARASAWPKVDRFLRRYAGWRDLARLSSLSQCLEAVLDETRYEDLLRAQPRGGARAANVQRLLAMTRDFDRLQRQGLFRFLQVIAAQREIDFDPEPAQADEADAVRLMSIHQSKGLEFPVVVVADLGKAFNLRDLSGSLVLDERYGLAPLVRPPGKRQTYPSLPHWLAGRRGRREGLGEEMRLLYVALTRARDRLILAGTVSHTAAEKWGSQPPGRVSAGRLLAARHGLDWVGPLIPHLTGRPDWLEQAEGVGTHLAWRLVTGAEGEPVPVPAGLDAALSVAPAGDELEALCRRLEWQYPQRAATIEPAKASVTALRQRAVEADDGEAARWFRSWSPAGHGARPSDAAAPRLTAAERGVAHHRFFELASLPALGSRDTIVAEIARLARESRLSELEVAALDVAALTAFGASELGARVRADAAWVRRELEFTARLSPADFASLALPCETGLGPEEFVVVQGVVDLAVVTPDALWIVDFKTDAVTVPDVAAKAAGYAAQLRLYALALSRIYARPATGAWLHFLAANRSVRVALPDTDPTSP